MALKLPKHLSHEEILEGIYFLDQGGGHPFADSTRYDVLYKGNRYPPKAVVGAAATIATGDEYTPYDFAGGLGSQCFRLLRDAGFTIVPKEGRTLFPDEVEEEATFHEGAVVQVKVNRYERDPRAREVCIEHFGPTCVVCLVNLEERYGPIGKGFIHVHHLKPLSAIGMGYRVRPKEDLRPVCPNCHAMLHQQKGEPFTIEELQEQMEFAKRRDLKGS